MNSRTQTVKALYKKLLCLATAFAMMAVILLPSVTVHAATEYLYLYGLGYVAGNSRVINCANYQYDPSTKTLTLKSGGTLNCSSPSFIRSSVSGLTIRVEKDLTVYGGEIALSADTTITGPGKLTIAPSEGLPAPIFGIYVTDGSKLTVLNANLDFDAVITKFGRNFASWGICGNKTGEQLIVRNSTIHAKANTAAISDFNWISIANCELASPRYAQAKNGNIYQNDGKTLAKKVKISNFYFVQKPESQVTGAVGDYVTLKAAVNRSGATFQWQRYNRERSRWENVSFSGAQSRTMRFQVDESMYSWRFRCVATSGTETIISDDVNLKVVARITSQPDSTVYVNSGATVLLKVSAEGTISRYTWQYYNNSTGKWVNLTSGTNFYNVGTKSMTVKGNSTTNNMKFRCAVMNTFGYTTYTDETTLKVR